MKITLLRSFIRIPTSANKWQLGDEGRILLAVGLRFHSRPRREIVVLQITQRECSIQPRRIRNRSNAANFFVVNRKNLSAALRTHFAFKYKPSEFLRHVPSILDARDDLLTEVAAFR